MNGLLLILFAGVTDSYDIASDMLRHRMAPVGVPRGVAEPLDKVVESMKGRAGS